MNNKGLIAIGAMFGIISLVILVIGLMIITATSYKRNNDYTLEQVNKRLNNTDINYTDAFQNIVQYTK